MDTTQASESWMLFMTAVWGLMVAAVILLVIWRIHKNKKRRQRRDASREAKRLVEEWRSGNHPPGPSPDP